MYLTVVIPCFNEEENIKKGVLMEVYDYLKAKQYDWEVIISDDGSTDKSKIELNKKLDQLKGFRVINNSHGGKPSALLSGIKVAKGKYILITDMDQSTPIGELGKLETYLGKGYDVVIGSRGLKRKDFPLYRKFGAAVFSTFRRFLILPEIKDTQCGFKLFAASKIQEAFPKLEFFKRVTKVKGWTVTSFDVELLHIVKKMECKIKEVEVVWNDRDESSSKGGNLQKYVKESREMFGQIIRVKINDLKGLYKN